MTVGTLLTTTPLCAQDGAASDWKALVIGNPSRNAPGAFGDSFHAAQVLKEAGLADVTLRRELGADAMAQALQDVEGVPRLVLYFSGAISVQSTGPVLMGKGGGDARSAVAPLLDRLAAAGTRELILLVEDCAGGQGMGGRLTLPTPPAGLNLFMAASAGPERSCSADTARMTDALTAPGPAARLTDRLAGTWTATVGTLSPPRLNRGGGDVTTVPTSAPTLTDQGAIPLVQGAPQVTLIANDTIRLTPAITPVSLTPAAQPGGGGEVGSLGGSATGTPTAVRDDQTVIFVAPSASQLAAVPVAEGLPEPSIIIGLIDGIRGTFGTVDDTPPEVGQTEITYENLEARNAMRDRDPELFASLVAGGAFDPPPTEIGRALQGELARMDCYTTTVDGIWGNGSRRAVDRYFAQLNGVTPITREATADLFRQILLEGDVICPSPVRTAAPAGGRTSGGGRNSGTAPRRPRPSAPAPTRTPAPSGGRIGGGGLSGVFR